MRSCFVFFFKQKTAYEMRISDWSSDVCSSDLRFFDRRLELGGRLTWYSKYDNPQLDEFTDPDDCVGGCVLNIPFTWDEILTFDAYAKFRINERFTAELTGLNLNNRYYLDPLSRSLLPAPR